MGDDPAPRTVSPVDRPYSTLAPYFAQLFRPRGIRGWFSRARALVTGAGVRDGWHLDVGAGTCRYSRYWTRAGFRSVCLDLLHEMLAEAKLDGVASRLSRVCGSIDCLRPKETFNLVTSIDDVSGYVGAQPGGFEQFLARLAPRMRVGGVFLFDFITPAGRRRYTFRNTRLLEVGRITASSRGRFDEQGRILSVEISFTAPDRVTRERHVLRLYTTEEMERFLNQAGFEVLAFTDLYDGAGVGYRADLPSYDCLARRVK
jgi:hypothetical protein